MPWSTQSTHAWLEHPHWEPVTQQSPAWGVAVGPGVTVDVGVAHEGAATRRKVRARRRRRMPASLRALGERVR